MQNDSKFLEDVSKYMLIILSLNFKNDTYTNIFKFCITKKLDLPKGCVKKLV